VTNTVSGQVSRFYYDADGQRVKRVDPSGTTAYVGQHFEVQASAGISTSYYYFGSQRVAMRVAPSGSYSGTLYWIQGDQLGSASLTTNITGTVVSEQRYYPFGETRWVSGTMPTDRLFAGMRSETASAVGSLIDMNAREYSPLLGRFLSADSIVPQAGDPQSLNRYTYARNSPLDRVDPSGHGDCNVNTTQGCVPWYIETQPLPQSTLFVTRWGGLIDSNHAYRTTIGKNVSEATKGNGTVNIGPMPFGTKTIGPFKFTLGTFAAEYQVKTGMSDKDVWSVALAIFEDYQTRFERAQQENGDPESGFAPEDLFSDLIGFYQEYTGKSFQQVINEDLGGVVMEMPSMYENVIHPFSVAIGVKNHEFGPWNVKAGGPMRFPESIRRQLDITPAPSGELWLYVGGVAKFEAR
jgi:RHS repeat-associated protein